MPIKVACPGCASRFQAPGAAAGRTLRCPKCQGGVHVPLPEPDFEVIDDDEPIAVEVVGDAPAPVVARRAAVARVAAQPAEVVDEPPPEKPLRKKRRRVDEDDPPAPLWARVAAGVAALTLLGGVLAVVIRGEPDPNMKSDGWYAQPGPDDCFAASFPGGKPQFEVADPGKLMRAAAKFSGEKSLSDTVLRMEVWARRHRRRDYAVALMSADGPDSESASVERIMIETLGQRRELVEQKEVAVNGVRGRHFVARNDERTLVHRSFRYGPRGLRQLGVSVIGDPKMDPADPEVAEFFERAEPNPGPDTEPVFLVAAPAKSYERYAPGLNEKRFKQYLATPDLFDESGFVRAIGEPSEREVETPEGKAPESALTWVKAEKGPSARAWFRAGKLLRGEFYAKLPPAE